MFSSNVMAVLSGIALICFLVLVGLQVAELMHYSTVPSIWPAVAQ